MKVTDYVHATRARPDRAAIKNEWILHVLEFPEHHDIQTNGRIRRWARVPEAGGRYLRVVLLPDGETVHNAFFDRRFRR